MRDAITGWYFVHASVKGVVKDHQGRLLLGKNPRDEWELPGGWPADSDASLEDTLKREVEEESGLEVAVNHLLGASLVRVEGSQVVIVVFSASCDTGGTGIRRSAEHSEVKFFDAASLPANIPDFYMSFIEKGVGRAL